MKWQYRTASVEARVRDGVGLYRLTGVVTMADIGAILKDASDWQENAEPLVVVMDLREAQQGVSLLRYIDMTRELAQTSEGLRIPAVLVAPKSQHSYYQAFAAALRGLGIERQVTTAISEAKSWARREASFRARSGFSAAPICTRSTPLGDVPSESGRT
jgi:hypothetical protein